MCALPRIKVPHLSSLPRICFLSLCPAQDQNIIPRSLPRISLVSVCMAQDQIVTPCLSTEDQLSISVPCLASKYHSQLPAQDQFGICMQCLGSNCHSLDLCLGSVLYFCALHKIKMLLSDVLPRISLVSVCRAQDQIIISWPSAQGQSIVFVHTASYYISKLILLCGSGRRMLAKWTWHFPAQFYVRYLNQGMIHLLILHIFGFSLTEANRYIEESHTVHYIGYIHCYACLNT